jgi:hypothetical protein
MIDEILKHGPVIDGQGFELNSAATPGVFRNFLVIYNSALDLVHVNETAVAAEYFYFGEPFLIPLHRQIPDTQTTHADILDPPRVDKLIASYKRSECPFFALEPFEFSFFLQHFSPLRQVRSEFRSRIVGHETPKMSRAISSEWMRRLNRRQIPLRVGPEGG